MTDKARKQTDKELNKLEREIYELYATASDEISAEWRKYMQSHKKKLDRLYDELQKAKKSNDNDAIKAAKEEYERAVKNVTLNDKRYKAMLNETTAKLANINQVALDYVNGDMPKIYTLNYNAFDDEKIDGYTFTLVNERAVENLIKSNKIELPPKKVNIPKDQAWNAKNINSQLLQGIIQGESIAKIAKRLQNVTDMNKRSALRNARTMVTGAENKGRQDSFKKAQDDGVIMEREWIAAHDDRTRAWHLDLHGVRVGVDEPWENDYGEIMFPGDPTADPANVYNCRCSIRVHVKGFRWNKETEAEPEKIEEPKQETIEAENIKEVSTRDEAYDVLNNIFGSISDNVNKIDEHLLCENVNQLQRLNAKFGAITENNTGYITSSPSRKAMAWTQGTFVPNPNGVVNENTNLGLVSTYYKDPELLLEKEKVAIEKFWSMPIDDNNLSVYGITHEYGHILENRILVSRTDYDALKEKFSTYNPALRHKEYQKVEKKAAGELFNEILTIAKENNPDFSLKNNLSGYGHTNSFEAFAETFANSQLGKPNELGIAMQQWLKKEGF